MKPLIVTLIGLGLLATGCSGASISANAAKVENEAPPTLIGERAHSYRNLQEVAQHADVVVRGEVISRAKSQVVRAPKDQAEIVNGGSNFRVNEWIVGSGPSVIEVSQVGTEGEVGVDTDGQAPRSVFSPLLRIGETYTLYLYRQLNGVERDSVPTGAYILAGDLGAYRLDASDSTEQPEWDFAGGVDHGFKDDGVVDENTLTRASEQVRRGLECRDNRAAMEVSAERMLRC